MLKEMLQNKRLKHEECEAIRIGKDREKENKEKVLRCKKHVGNLLDIKLPSTQFTCVKSDVEFSIEGYDFLYSENFGEFINKTEQSLINVGSGRAWWGGNLFYTTDDSPKLYQIIICNRCKRKIYKRIGNPIYLDLDEVPEHFCGSDTEFERKAYEIQHISELVRNGKVICSYCGTEFYVGEKKKCIKCGAPL